MAEITGQPAFDLTILQSFLNTIKSKVNIYRWLQKYCAYSSIIAMKEEPQYSRNNLYYNICGCVGKTINCDGGILAQKNFFLHERIFFA